MNEVEHLLMKAAEEAGEVAQMAGKCGVFGLHDCHPKYGNIPNVDLLVAEVNDLVAVVEMLGAHGANVSGLGNRYDIDKKKMKVSKWMAYARERGTLCQW